MDNEVSGTGNMYDYGFRIYNPRIGRFLSVDPLFKSYAMLTPYQYASNRPIDGIDLDGLEHVQIIHFRHTTGMITNTNYKTVETKLTYGNTHFKPGTEHIYADWNEGKSRMENIYAARGNKTTYSRYTDYNEVPFILFQSGWPLYLGGTKVANEWNYYEGKEGLIDRGGWKVLAISMTSPLLVYTAATGITVTVGEGITAKIAEGLGKVYMDALAQGLAKGDISDIDWGDAMISGIPASKYLKAVMKAAVDLTSEGVSYPESVDKLGEGASFNILFEELKTGSGNPIIKFTVDGVANKYAKDKAKQYYQDEKKETE